MRISTNKLEERAETKAGPLRRNWNRRRALLITLVLFFSYAYFYEAGGWNQNSRFDLMRAILDEHTLHIDSYHTNTEDKAFFQGHYYSDKAPGLVLLALPALAATRPVMRWVGVDPRSAPGLVAQSYIATLFSVSLPVALATAFLFLLALRLGSSVGAAAFAAISLGLATPNWAFATLLFGHALAGASILFSFDAAERLQEEGCREFLLALFVGVTAGWATVTEYPAAPVSVLLAILALAQVWRRGRRSRWRVAAGVALGALACLAVLLAYQYAAFGSPFQLGYSHYQAGAFPWMESGFHGLTYPKPLILVKLLVGGHLGLFLLAPVMAAAPFGLRWMWKQSETHRLSIAAAAIPLYYWLLNGSFSAWHGGWTWGPRYMLAGIPVLCLGLAPVWDRAGQRLRWVLGILAIWGAAWSLMAEATTPQPPQLMRFPAVELIWPSFWAARFSLNPYSMLTASDEAGGPVHGAFNLGELVGLHGFKSLLPLVLIWVAAGYLWVWISRCEKNTMGRQASIRIRA